MRTYTDDELDVLRDEFPDYQRPDCGGAYCGEANCITCGDEPTDDEEVE